MIVGLAWDCHHLGRLFQQPQYTVFKGQLIIKNGHETSAILLAFFVSYPLVLPNQILLLSCLYYTIFER
nr:MAG TPA: hypothetical protein [Caudoviricetes sp.]